MGMLRRGLAEVTPRVSLASAMAGHSRRRTATACATPQVSAVAEAARSREGLALMRTSPLAALLSTEHGTQAPAVSMPLATPHRTPCPVLGLGGALRPTRVSSQIASALASKYQLDATAPPAPDMAAEPPVSECAAFDKALSAVADDVLQFKSADLERRPQWRAPQAPTPREVDALIAKLRGLAFPEYYSARPAGSAAGASPSFDSALGAGVRTHAADRALMRAHLQEVMEIIADMTKRALIIDAVEADANATCDPDLPDHLRHCKLGEGVRDLSGDAVESIAAAHTRNVVLPQVLRRVGGIVRDLNADVAAAHRLDVATSSRAEVALTYPGITALMYHRVAHALLKSGAPVMLCRLISERSHAQTGVDIHPGVSIGPGCFIDHGTGLVIGGTAEIGANVCLFHGVTLGSKAFPTDADGNRIKHLKRHPIVEDGASIYAGATVLGRVTIGRGATVAAGVTLSQDLPPNHTAANPRGATVIIPPKIADPT